MKPVVNPWIFYFAKVSDNIRFLASFALFILSVSSVVSLFAYAYFKSSDGYDEVSNEDIKNLTSVFKKISLSIIVFFTLFVFTPDKETCYQMIISSQVTTENVQKVEEVIKDSVDYIIEKMNDNWKENRYE